MVRNGSPPRLSLAPRLPQQVVRSTGRIPKQIPILLIGSDLDGRVFSESTHTVLLSLHGAGILSRHKLSAEQELVLRWTERNKETEIRVVGHIGTSGEDHTYGVAFFDSDLNFWELDFPPISQREKEMGLLSLACSTCGALDQIDDSSIEADICATGQGVIRFCKHCGTTTLWKHSQSQAVLAPISANPSPSNGAQLGLFPSSAPPNPPPATPIRAPMPPAPSALPPPAPIPPAPKPSFYASVGPMPQTTAPLASPPSAKLANPAPPAPRPGAHNDVQADTRTEPRTTVLTLPPPREPDHPRTNRRKHPRVKVSYSALVRHPERGDDVVACEDMSRGGLRFKSKKTYYERSLIEVAAPYVPGQIPIFVPAQIVFIQELPEQQLIRYGAAYLQIPKPNNFF
jgi:hypothetical protein